MMDGNFSMGPHGFLHLYVIRVPLSETSVYSLLQNKTQDIYEELLQAVMNRCHELDTFPDPISHCRLWTLYDPCHMYSTFTRQKTHDYFYHLTQSTGTRLHQHYRNDDSFRQFCGELDIFALLPVYISDTAAGMSHLRAICPPEDKCLLCYFDSVHASGTILPSRRNHEKPYFSTSAMFHRNYGMFMKLQWKNLQRLINSVKDELSILSPSRTPSGCASRYYNKRKPPLLGS